MNHIVQGPGAAATAPHGPYYNHRVAGHKLLGDIREEELARHFD